MICSMSRKGNCTMRVTESFFATLKRELEEAIFSSLESALQ